MSLLTVKGRIQIWTLLILFCLQRFKKGYFIRLKNYNFNTLKALPLKGFTQIKIYKVLY